MRAACQVVGNTEGDRTRSEDNRAPHQLGQQVPPAADRLVTPARKAA